MAIRRGGAIHAAPQAQFTIEDCLFTDNHSLANSGGAIFMSKASGVVRSCEFSANMAGSGGAIYAEAVHTVCSPIPFSPAILPARQRERQAAGAPSSIKAPRWSSPTAILSTTTMRTPHSAEPFTAIYYPTTEITNSILWGNMAKDAPQIYDAAYQGVQPVTIVSYQRRGPGWLRRTQRQHPAGSVC